ncbi:E3 ubiquitin-protein ligase SopA [Balamuthia mandrillaris]
MASQPSMLCVTLPLGFLLLLTSFFVFFPAPTAATNLIHNSIGNAPRETLLQKLYATVQGSQYKKDQSYSPPFWFEQKGLFHSDIHLNVAGGEAMALFRNLLSIPDMNFFTTAFILESVFEAQRLREGFLKRTTPEENCWYSSLGKEQVLDAVNAMSGYWDRNEGPGTPMRTFWPQVKENGTWVTRPINIYNLILTEGSFANAIHTLLDDLGLDFLWQKIATVLDTPHFYLHAFYLPCDFDDSAANIAVGALLKHHQQCYPEAFDAWNKGNNNLTAFAEKIKRYSYQPFSKNLDNNAIDPRTYYFMHEYLEQKQNQAKQRGEVPDVRLVATWSLSLSETTKMAPIPGMPGNINNVDASVAANTIYGITTALLFNLSSSSPSKGGNNDEWFDKELQQIYQDSAEYVRWTITSGQMVKRPDIGLLYYPSLYDHYWFIARLVFLLDTSSPSSVKALYARFPVVQRVKNMFEEVMSSAGTKQLISLATVEEGNGYIYWDDFLGDGDIDIFGQPLKRGEDRLFSTAISVIALIDTWTTPGAGTNSPKLQWKSGTPAQVKDYLPRAVKFLEDNIYSWSYRVSNAFFSGSIKGLSTLSFFYPLNFAMWANGTMIKNLTLEDILEGKHPTVGVSGFISSDVYQQMIDNPRFPGYPVPQTFPGYNHQEGDIFILFPYWSSDPLTYSMTALAITKFSAIPSTANGDNISTITV